LVRLEDFQKKKKELEEAKAREAARSNDLKICLGTTRKRQRSARKP